MKANPSLNKRKAEPILPLMPKKSDRYFVDLIHEAYYGWSPVKMNERNKNLERAIEHEKRQAEQAKQQTEQVKQQAALEARKLAKSIRVFSKELGWNAAKIAAQLGMETAEVETILARKR